MKNLLKIVGCFGLVFLLIISTGCDNKDDVNKNNESETKKEGLIIEVGYDQSAINLVKKVNGKLLFNIINHIEVPSDINIIVDFYDQNNNKIGSSNVEKYAVGTDAIIPVQIIDTPKNIDDYKYSIKMIYYETEKKSYYDKVELTHKKINDDIQVNVKNTSNENIEVVNVLTVFFNDEQIVGFTDANKTNISAGLTVDINVDNNNIDYDDYNVYLVEAYSNK